MSYKSGLPIILSHNTHTGICVFPNRRFGNSRDMLIVGLNREVDSGDEFEISDIDWVKAVLHFSDIESLQITVNTLNKVLRDWEKEQRRNGKHCFGTRKDDDI